MGRSPIDHQRSKYPSLGVVLNKKSLGGACYWVVAYWRRSARAFNSAACVADGLPHLPAPHSTPHESSRGHASHKRSRMRLVSMPRRTRHSAPAPGSRRTAACSALTRAPLSTKLAISHHSILNSPQPSFTRSYTEAAGSLVSSSRCWAGGRGPGEELTVLFRRPAHCRPSSTLILVEEEATVPCRRPRVSLHRTCTTVSPGPRPEVSRRSPVAELHGSLAPDAVKLVFVMG